MPKVSDLLCCECGCDDVVCVDPGQSPVIDVVTDIVLAHGRPARATCLDCWHPLPQQHLPGVDLPTVFVACSPAVRAATPRSSESWQESLW